MLTIKSKIFMIVLIAISLLNIMVLIANKQTSKDKYVEKLDDSKSDKNVNENQVKKVKTPIQDKYCLDFNANATDQDRIPQDVSFIQLISNPKEYHCKKIRVTGFAILEYEEFSLYFHQDDYEQLISKNAFSLDTSKNFTGFPKNQSIDKKYVTVEGDFDAYQKGYHSGFIYIDKIFIKTSIQDIHREVRRLKKQHYSK